MKRAWGPGFMQPKRAASDQHCPHCRKALYVALLDGTFECDACRGTFCTAEAFKTLVADAVDTQPDVQYQRTPLDISKPVRYVPCPTCSKVMNRKNFGDTSGIILDVCKHHGVWLDEGELEGVLAYCASGAFTRAQTDAARRGTQRKALDDHARSLETPSASSWDALPVDVVPLSVIDLATSLFDW